MWKLFTKIKVALVTSSGRDASSTALWLLYWLYILLILKYFFLTRGGCYACASNGFTVYSNILDPNKITRCYKQLFEKYFWMTFFNFYLNYIEVWTEGTSKMRQHNPDTVNSVCNDHLYNKSYYLWFIQQCGLMITEGTNLLVLTIYAYWSSSRAT